MERDATYYASRRSKFSLRFQDEMQAVFECRTDAELGRYFRARIAAEKAGCVDENARTIAGKGPALACLERVGWLIQEDVETYARSVDCGSAGAKKRWGTQ